MRISIKPATTEMTNGSNQHYIPSFVQRAFGIPKKRKEIWHFGLGRAPERRLIKRTGSENSFYSRPSRNGRPTLDDAITDIEPGLSRVLRKIRSISPGEHIDPTEAAAIINHLASRTAHVRSIFSDGLAHLLNRAETFFAEPDSIETVFGLDGDAPSDRFKNVVLDELARNAQIAKIGLPLQLLERLSFAFLKENSGQLISESTAIAGEYVKGLRSQSSELVRQGHTKALDPALGTMEYESLLRTLEWNVTNAQGAGAILPDCVVMAVDEEGRANAHLLVGSKRLGGIVMAVSPEKLLVGRMPGFEMPDDFNFNLEAARVSHGFFLSARNDLEMLRLHTMIGEHLQPTLEENIESAFEEVLTGKADTRPSIVQGAAERSSPWKPTSRLQYKLSLVDCGDQATTQRIQSRITAMIADVAQVLQLERLDAITIGHDYPALLQTVDRGLENAPPVETVSSDVGTGVAQTIMVIRSGVAKSHVVLSNAVSMALLSNDQNEVDWAVHVLVNQLALVALVSVVDEALPGIWLSPFENEIDGWLYGNVHAALDGYAASWIAAAFGDKQEIANTSRDLLVGSIDRLISLIPEERLAYRQHGDLGKLLDVVLPEICNTLRFAADLLGHCSFTAESPFDQSNALKEALERAQLTKWFEWYRGHLDRFHRRLGRWTSFGEFLEFNIHVERLLFAVGMFPWQGPEGIRVEIPPGTDAQILLKRKLRGLRSLDQHTSGL